MTEIGPKTPRLRECIHCGNVLSGKKELFCSQSCRMRHSRGVPATKAFKNNPALLEAEVREWRTIEGFLNYEISNDGRVRRAIAGSNRKVGAILRYDIGRMGYPEYRLTNFDGKIRACLAHKLVALAFLPTPSADEVFVLHRDDNKLNPVFTNLRWGTAQDNANDAARNGRILRGDERLRQRQPRHHDLQYLIWLRKQPCCVCKKQPPSEAAHLRGSALAYGKPPTGMQEKPSDEWSVPLCSWCHRLGPESQHVLGNEEKFWNMHGINPFDLAVRLYAEGGSIAPKRKRKPRKTIIPKGYGPRTIPSRPFSKVKRGFSK